MNNPKKRREEFYQEFDRQKRIVKATFILMTLLRAAIVIMLFYIAIKILLHFGILP